MIIDSQPAAKFAENNDDLKILDEPFEEEEYAICLKKGNDELLDKINGALEELKEDGTIDSIMDNYIGDDAGKTPYESPEDVDRSNGTMRLRREQNIQTENLPWQPMRSLSHTNIMMVTT